MTLCAQKRLVCESDERRERRSSAVGSPLSRRLTLTPRRIHSRRSRIVVPGFSFDHHYSPEGHGMDAQRFDAIARLLAARLSRRAALQRGAAGLAASALALLGVQSVRAAARAQEVCTDPSRPGVGCACTTGTQDPCGDNTLLCCANDPNGPPGGPGTCTPSSVGCNPMGPPSSPCTSHGCRCNGGVQGNCDEGLSCCPDNPGLPGGPGRCVRQDKCNLQNCTGEGCSCHSGTEGACDDGLICCADDASTPGWSRPLRSGGYLPGAPMPGDDQPLSE